MVTKNSSYNVRFKKIHKSCYKAVACQICETLAVEAVFILYNRWMLSIIFFFSGFTKDGVPPCTVSVAFAILSCREVIIALMKYHFCTLKQ